MNYSCAAGSRYLKYLGSRAAATAAATAAARHRHHRCASCGPLPQTRPTPRAPIGEGEEPMCARRLHRTILSSSLCVPCFPVSLSFFSPPPSTRGYVSLSLSRRRRRRPPPLLSSPRAPFCFRFSHLVRLLLSALASIPLFLIISFSLSFSILSFQLVGNGQSPSCCCCCCCCSFVSSFLRSFAFARIFRDLFLRFSLLSDSFESSFRRVDTFRLGFFLILFFSKEMETGIRGRRSARRRYFFLCFFPSFFLSCSLGKVVEDRIRVFEARDGSLVGLDRVGRASPRGFGVALPRKRTRKRVRRAYKCGARTAVRTGAGDTARGSRRAFALRTSLRAHPLVGCPSSFSFSSFTIVRSFNVAKYHASIYICFSHDFSLFYF